MEAGDGGLCVRHYQKSGWGGKTRPTFGPLTAVIVRDREQTASGIMTSCSLPTKKYFLTFNVRATPFSLIPNRIHLVHTGY